MEIAYCTRLIPHIPDLYEKYPKQKFIVSVDRYIMNQILGIEESTGKRVQIINIPEVPSYPRFPEIFLQKRSWSHAENSYDIDIQLINLPVVRQMIAPHEVYRKLNSWAKKSGSEKKTILTYSTNPMSMSALVKLKRKEKDVRIVLVVGDLIGDKGIHIEGKGVINKLLNQYYQRGSELVSEFDGYIFVTKYMAEELKVETKPVLVIEGIYNKDYEKKFFKEQKGKNDEKIVFYAGSLERQFGVFNLITAFSMIRDNKYRLWLAGGSSEADEIEKCCKNDPRIKYYGFVTPQKVYELQEQATIIVNPRTSEGEFTKFSFPSKTMEGLASSKPFVGCKLPGIPKEYFDYIQYVNDDKPETLYKKMIEICELPENERIAIGQRARDFILKEKNCQIQGEKIVNFLDSLY